MSRPRWRVSAAGKDTAAAVVVAEAVAAASSTCSFSSFDF
jgi:hypothetical protein